MSSSIAGVTASDRDHRPELTEAELAGVSGGGKSGAGTSKVSLHSFTITKHFDKASPVLL